MTTRSGKVDHPESGAVRRQTAYRANRARGAALVVLAISPPILCAFLAGRIDRWDLFERSGAITTAIGLLLASRRYIRYGVHELALLHAQKLQLDVTEVFEDIFTAKRGLALSAFGTIIWGWGKYLRWWSFLCLLVWALFAVRDARRDSTEGGAG
jgi:hypothetical protein